MIVQPAQLQLKSPRGFLALEGLNGAGKTTVQNRIAERTQARGRECVSTREPGATKLGEKLRSLILGYDDDRFHERAELFLFAADRAEHVAKVIEPALERGAVIVSDRYLYSTVAFQGYGRELGHDLTMNVNAMAVSGCYPDFVILLDLEPEEGLRRNVRARSGESKTEEDAFEIEKLEFHRRIREGFLKIAEISKEPFVVIDASQDINAVFKVIDPIIDKWLEQLSG